jgi:hypothetical protein
MGRGRKMTEELIEVGLDPEEKVIRFGMIPAEVIDSETLSPGAKSLYCNLFLYQGRNDYAWPSVKLLCKKVPCSRPSFYKYRYELEEAGWLKVIRRQSERTGGDISSLYQERLQHASVKWAKEHAENTKNEQNPSVDPCKNIEQGGIKNFNTPCKNIGHLNIENKNKRNKIQEDLSGLKPIGNSEKDSLPVDNDAKPLKPIEAKIKTTKPAPDPQAAAEFKVLSDLSPNQNGLGYAYRCYQALRASLGAKQIHSAYLAYLDSYAASGRQFAMRLGNFLDTNEPNGISRWLEAAKTREDSLKAQQEARADEIVDRKAEELEAQLAENDAEYGKLKEKEAKALHAFLASTRDQKATDKAKQKAKTAYDHAASKRQGYFDRKVGEQIQAIRDKAALIRNTLTNDYDEMPVA